MGPKFGNDMARPEGPKVALLHVEIDVTDVYATWYVSGFKEATDEDQNKKDAPKYWLLWKGILIW